jgi:excisionase family DNA binding protein
MRQKKVLTVPEAAQELGITERAAWQRVYRKQIPFRRWGRKVVVIADELDNFLKGLPGAQPRRQRRRQRRRPGERLRPHTFSPPPLR